MKLFSPCPLVVLLLAAPFILAFNANSQTTAVIGWGFNSHGQANTPPSLTNIVAVSAGGGESVVLRANGTVFNWGFPFDPPMPPGLTNVMAIECGRGHALALQSNGLVVAWGDNSSGQAKVPEGLSNVVAISGGSVHSLAVTAEGTVVAWGDNSLGQCTPPPEFSDVIAVSAGGNSTTAYSVALKSDGTVVAWGDNRLRQTDIPEGLSNVVAVEASPFVHTVALKSDGTVVAWGVGSLATNVPRGLSNVVAITAGSGYSLALQANGMVVAWGDNFENETNVPASARNISAIASGWFHNVIVRRSTAPAWPRIVEHPQSRRILVGQPVTLSVTATSAAPVSYQWQRRGRPIPNATNSMLVLIEPQTSESGDYAVIVRADGLSVRSAPAFLDVREPPVATTAAVVGVEDTDLIVTLRGVDPSGLPLAATVVSLPTAGAIYQFDSGQRGIRIETAPTLVTDPGLRIVFVPEANKTGAGSGTIVFSVHNEIGESTPGLIFVNLEPVNDPPSFVAGPSQEVLEDAGTQSVIGWASALRTGPIDEAGQRLAFIVTNDNVSLFSRSPSINAVGDLVYTPAPDASGIATVTVLLRDNGGTNRAGVDVSPAQTFTIKVMPVNDAPVGRNDSVLVNEDSSIAIFLQASDVEGDALVYTVGPPGHGSLSGTPPNLIYRPAANYSGPDIFTFSANDGRAFSDPATVSIVVLPVNDPPVAIARAFSATGYSNDGLGHVVVLAPNNAGAGVVLDGSFSEDPENGPLEYFWFESGEAIPFATGVRVTNELALGTHSIVLRISDGQNMASSELTLDVITAGEAVDGLLLRLVNTPGLKAKTRPLFATLKAAIASFDRGSAGAGLNQLQAAQNKIRAQIGRADPTLADELIRAVQHIAEAVR